MTTYLNDLPVIIDGPGDYKLRNGGRASIVRVVENQNSNTTSFDAKGSTWRMFRGKLRPRGNDIWHVSGRKFLLTEDPEDIVEKLPD